MDYIKSIEIGLKEKKPYNEIVRKIYLSHPTMALIGDEERQYNILNEISTHFSIPIIAVQVAGSAKTGKSFHKRSDFTPGESDLDIAIIHSGLFQKHMEMVFTVTKGCSDRTGFPLKNGTSTADDYISYISRGIFRPDLIPSCPARIEWNKFFGQLSKKHGDLFKSINAGIYLSQVFFENKQRSAIKNYLSNKAV